MPKVFDTVELVIGRVEDRTHGMSWEEIAAPETNAFPQRLKAPLEQAVSIWITDATTRVRTGPKDAALREARVCYDHLAGERGVELLNGAKQQGFIAGDGPLVLTDKGRAFFGEFGIDLSGLEKGRRLVCRACLDWSEQRSHLGGALGAAILSRLLEKGWVRRDAGRVVTFTCEGLGEFRSIFTLSASAYRRGCPPSIRPV
jgi:hypothetical protein